VVRPPLDPTGRNERLTATTATVLLVLLAVEGFTILSVRQMLSVHIVVGLLLIPPVVLKLASTGYRFLRYYTGDAAFVSKGPPHLAMRLLAPLLVLSTVVLFGTGVALLALGPENGHGIVLGLHKASFIVWFFVMSVHVLVYAPRLPRALRAGNLWSRAGLVTGSLVAGVVLAGSAYSLAGPWLHRAHDDHREGAAYLSVFR
jgi:accessory gene regulator protein AgrB